MATATLTTSTLNGKPYAGNPHVRFDEGEVASENPRRGSLLYKRKPMMTYASCLALAVLLDVANAAVEVKCRNGVFVGECDAQTKIASFKGIPFAKPPVGALRWKAPVAAEASSVRREAKAFGFSALQVI